MGFVRSPRWTSLLVITLLGIFGALAEDWLPEETESVCNSNDLNHSELVECKLTQCDELAPKPENSLTTGKFLHIISSRSGDRFSTNLLDGLDYVESEYEKSMDINTTLYVDTRLRYREIHGFGTTIDLSSTSENVLDATIQDIIKQLFSQKNEGLRFVLLRIPIGREILSKGKVMSVLGEVDDVLSKALGNEIKVKLVLSFDYWPSTAIEDIQALEAISLEGLKALECWAIAIPYLPSQGVVAEGLWDFIRDRCSETRNMFSHVPMSKAAQHTRELSPSIRGLLVQSDFESTYSGIDQVLKMREDLNLITIGSPKSLVGDYGNWQTAQHHAIEIMNHLKHDSSGFIEIGSVIDVFSGNQKALDGSIYNLGPKYESYLKGPIFYAMGHFSKYVLPGSKRLGAELSTQPNMFAADYMAFITPNEHVVAVVLNDNEHDLPFRLAIDQRIRVHVMLKSKSFNTFIIKP